MARVPISEVVINESGVPLSGVTCNVYAARTVTPSTIYAAESGGATLANPQTTVAGEIAGWLEEGEYDLALSGAGITPETRRFNAIVGGNPKLAAGQVTATELAADSVGSSEIQTDAVGSPELQVVSDSDLASPNNSVYRSIFGATTFAGDDQAAATYLFAPDWSGILNGVDISSSGALVGFGIETIYLDSADYLVAGKATKLRVRFSVDTNATAPTRTWTCGLYPVTFAGAADQLTFTLGTVVPNSTAAINAPPASSSTVAVSSDFDVPAAGVYAFGVVQSGGAIANNAAMKLTARLQMRHV